MTNFPYTAVHLRESGAQLYSHSSAIDCRVDREHSANAHPTETPNWKLELRRLSLAVFNSLRKTSGMERDN